MEGGSAACSADEFNGSVLGSANALVPVTHLSLPLSTFEAAPFRWPAIAPVVLYARSLFWGPNDRQDAPALLRVIEPDFVVINRFKSNKIDTVRAIRKVPTNSEE